MLYSKPCKRQIREKIALHYPEGEYETVWEQVQRQYVTFLRRLAHRAFVSSKKACDKWGFSRTWPKCSIGFRSVQRRYYI